MFDIETRSAMSTHYHGTPEEVRALDTWIKFTRAVDSFGSRLAGRGTCSEVTVTQFGVLEALHHLGPLRQGEIGAKLLRSGGNITLVVDNLEARGLVQRTRSAHDRRVVTVSLTEAGEALIAEMFPKHVRAIVEEMSVLTADEQETLGRLCRKLGKREKVIGADDEQ
jgi:MarR family 2-MHQ and catechol resistance regulon transcriptional repressor